MGVNNFPVLLMIVTIELTDIHLTPQGTLASSIVTWSAWTDRDCVAGFRFLHESWPKVQFTE